MVTAFFTCKRLYSSYKESEGRKYTGWFHILKQYSFLTLCMFKVTFSATNAWQNRGEKVSLSSSFRKLLWETSKLEMCNAFSFIIFIWKGIKIPATLFLWGWCLNSHNPPRMPGTQSSFAQHSHLCTGNLYEPKTGDTAYLFICHKWQRRFRKSRLKVWSLEESQLIWCPHRGKSVSLSDWKASLIWTLWTLSIIAEKDTVASPRLLKNKQLSIHGRFKFN